MIIETIKKANMQALRDKNQTARAVYSILLNKFNLLEIEKRTSGEHMTDADAVRVISKTIKELTEEAENYQKVNNIEARDNVLSQREILEQYLPKMLSESEIKTILSKLEDKTTPAVMKHFKENYAGQCDMGLVNKILREM